VPRLERLSPCFARCFVYLNARRITTIQVSQVPFAFHSVPLRRHHARDFSDNFAANLAGPSDLRYRFAEDFRQF
jgi:hypothetical protein